MNEQYLLSESTLRWIRNHQAEKILRCLVDYNTNLENEDAMNLVEYEITITNLIMPNIVEEKSNLFSFPNIEEKKQLINDISLELNALNKIKKHQKEKQCN